MFSYSGSANLPAATPIKGVPRAEWWRLAESVREWDPDVVVLVARKTARMREALGLDFSNRALIISDLAIPFVAHWFQDARIAVVDDVVNVGSTIRYITSRVEACGARDVRAFAIARLKRDQRLSGLDVSYTSPQELSETGLREFGQEVPQTLQGLAKPYDLDFPLLRCAPEIPYSTFDEIVAVLRERYADDVYELSTPDGIAAGVRRLAVDLQRGDGVNRKVRMYFSPSTQWHVVPMEVHPVLPTEAPGESASPWAHALYDAMVTQGLPDDPDANARLRLFADSLSLGERFLRTHADLFRVCSDPIDLDDATMVLGPGIREARSLLPTATAPPLCDETRTAFDTASLESPFLKEATERGLIDAARDRLSGNGVYSVLSSFMETLAEWTGTNNHTRYKFGWPYSPEKVQAEPYLRLRVGPTLADLVAIVAKLNRTGENDGSIWHEVTHALDNFIDVGSIVPTTANYGCSVYRIYRKGEGPSRNAVSDMVQNALYEYEQATLRKVIKTRATKVLTLMAFSEGSAAIPGVGVSSWERGNVSTYPQSLLDDGAEVINYMIRDGRLVEDKK
jgi:hypothetical protein